MSSQKPKKRPKIKVQVSFEASRVSDDCLASAYEQVIPVHSRTTRKQTQLVTQEEINLFDSLDFG